MAEQKSFTLKTKEIIYIIIALLTIATFIGRTAIIANKVEENSKTLDKYNLNLLEYRVDQIDEKVDKILEILNRIE